MNILYLSGVRIPSEKASGLAIVRQCQAFVEIGHEVELVIPNRAFGNSEGTIESVYGIIPSFNIKSIRSKALYSFGKFGFGLMLSYEGLRMFLYFLFKKSKADIIYSRDQRLLFFFILFGFFSW